MKKAIIIYHADCPDGFGAAWAARKKLGEKAIYFAALQRSSPPNEVAGKDVYLVDFCYPEETLKKVAKKARSVTLIDHHITNKVMIPLVADSSFRMDRSGSVLSWMYFHPGKKIPKLLSHIQDMDLWRFRLKHTKELVEFLESHKFDFKLWNRFAKGFENKKTIKNYILEGAALVRRMEKYIEKAVQSAETVTFEGHKCLMVNSPNFGSYVAHRLIQRMPPIGIVWSKRGDKIRVSLRSDGTVDVAKLAEKYGGGGHREAAGLSLPAKGLINFSKLKK